MTVTGWVRGGGIQATSDRRLKDNAVELEVKDLNGVKGYRYLFRPDGKVHVGLIAQEVQTILPEAVSEGVEGYLAIDYNAVVAMLLNIVREQGNRIRALEERTWQ